ncbi:MAG TPA: nucleoside monophosphate kinase, partial [Gemmatimonadaceae bacterium]|nr:nucleoside monophosphate kinase [Gemmatimonadaceae bacterium]
KKIGAVLVFDILDEELVRRISGRVVCEGCQTPVAGRDVGEQCAKCGGRLVRRADDDPAAVRHRLEVYKQQTAPVIEWYAKHGAKIIRINAVGTPDQVRDRILKALAR